MASERTIIIDKDLDASYSIVQLAIHKRSNFSIENSDSNNYRITVKVSMSAFAYGERMQVYLNPVNDHKTEITISSSSNVGIEFAGASKNHKNVEDLIESIYDCLETGSSGSIPSVSARPISPVLPMSAPSPVRQPAPLPATPANSASRYTRVYLDEEEKYFVETPIVLSACALLKDSKVDRVVAQLKFRNIGQKNIKALIVELLTFDMGNRPLEENVKYTYLDLNIARDEYFGSQNAIPMPDRTIRRIDVNISEIVFEDNSIQNCSECHRSILPPRDKLEVLFDDSEIVNQYRIETTEKAVYKPLELNDLWLCTCGAINHKDESNCHICGIGYNTQISALDENSLQSKAKERIDKAEYERKKAILNKAKRIMDEPSSNAFNEIGPYEHAILELKNVSGFEDADELIEQCNKEIEAINKRKEQEKAEIIAKAKRKKRKRTAIISSLTAIVIISGTVIALWNPIIQPSINYNEAIGLYNEGKYEEAKIVFTELADWADSNNMAYECEKSMAKIEYDKAKALFEEEKYEEAKSVFSKIDTWFDSLDQMFNCDYNIALKLFNEGSYEKAIKVFERINNWLDSSQWIEKCKDVAYKKATELKEKHQYDEAIELWVSLGDYNDSQKQIGYSLFESVDEKHISDKIKELNLQELYIPDNITNISNSEFYSCTSLVTVIIPDGVTSIGKQAFRNCSNLSSINIPNSVTLIDEYAFMDCTSLDSISIPDNVNRINQGAFQNCSSLKSIAMPQSITTIASSTFLNCPFYKFKIPDNVTAIGESAFNGCSNLTSINIPNNVTYIANYAFMECSSLVSVKMPNNIAKIGDKAFYRCKLSEVTLPKNCDIGYNSFVYGVKINYK